MFGKVLFTGGSKGFGKALLHELHGLNYLDSCDVLSRTESINNESINWLACDLSKADELQRLQLQNEYDTLIYCAGGGPFGEFKSQKIKSHKWAYSVNFFSFVELVHRFNFKNICYIGSSIALKQTEELALSYANAKANSRDFILRMSKSYPNINFFNFEPGYMNTSLLPYKRQKELGLNVKEVRYYVDQWVNEYRRFKEGSGNYCHWHE